ncbi:MAG: TIGR02206 family membrane protein [Saprospiraceae bacterium]|jgi:hypothetical integral membrane protein (TIGR02206 family)
MHEHYIVPVLSTQWFWGLLFSLIVYGLLLWAGMYAKQNGFEDKYRYFLTGIFIIREVYLFAYIFQMGQFTVQDSLPLHLCNISYISLIIVLIKPNYFLFEFILMLGLAGALQSLITPELTHGYSDYFFLDYYFSHSAIIFVPLYAIIVLNMKPRDRSWLRVFCFGNLVLIAVYCLNLLFNSNYIYLMEAPKANNPLILHPYPMHLIGFEVFGFLHIVFIYWLSRKYFIPKTI